MHKKCENIIKTDCTTLAINRPFFHKCIFHVNVSKYEKKSNVDLNNNVLLLLYPILQ